MLEHQIHKADEHAFELQWLQRIACVTVQYVKANERVNTLGAQFVNG